MIISKILDSKFFRACLAIILILVIIILVKQVTFFIKTIRIITSLFIIPMLLGGFVYYLLRPMVDFLTKYVKYRQVAMLISFIFLIGLIAFVIYFGGNIITEQSRNLVRQFTNYYYSELPVPEEDNFFFEVGTQIMEYLETFNIQERLSNFLENLLEIIKNNIFGIFTTLTNIGTVIILIPFVVYYLLKDDHKIKESFLLYCPTNKKDDMDRLLTKIDITLSKYIRGQVLIAFILGVLTYIGFIIIGLSNALILSVIVMVTSLIPFLGPILGILPAVFIGMSQSLLMVVKIILVLLIVQQIEGNIIQPNVQGSRLKIHPLVVIFMVLIFITLFGFIGALYAVPTYAVAKVILSEYYGKINIEYCKDE